MIKNTSVRCFKEQFGNEILKSSKDYKNNSSKNRCWFVNEILYMRFRNLKPTPIKNWYSFTFLRLINRFQLEISYMPTSQKRVSQKLVYYFFISGIFLYFEVIPTAACKNPDLSRIYFRFKKPTHRIVSEVEAVLAPYWYNQISSVNFRCLET